MAWEEYGGRQERVAPRRRRSHWSRAADACPGADGRIAPRSGLAVKSFIDTGAGVIDADYRGEVKVLLFNHADADFEGTLDNHKPALKQDWTLTDYRNTVREGDRVAQLVLERVRALYHFRSVMLTIM